MNKEVDYLLSPESIRERTHQIYRLCEEGETHFNFHKDKLKSVAEYVCSVIKENYPNLNIPYHSRWGHFNAGKIDRLSHFFRSIKKYPASEQARIKYDLVLVSVLLDAGAGAAWRYKATNEDKFYQRSEGLALASFDMFKNGLFSANKDKNPLRVDAQRLLSLSLAELSTGMQISVDNPLDGLEGRLELLRSLGRVMLSKADFFQEQRPGSLIDYLLKSSGLSDLNSKDGEKVQIEAKKILRTVLLALGEIWPGRIVLAGQNLGDAWHYLPLGEGDKTIIPFHKLSQWLSYSLVEPLEALGLEVAGLDKLTGLAEYRNGGLFIDAGILTLKDPSLAKVKLNPGHPLIIEWRAMTIQLLDQVAELIRLQLSLKAVDFPLVKILEGGTWWAGRRLALQRRPDMSPPLSITTDGTVF